MSIAVDLERDGTAVGEHQLKQKEWERPEQDVERARYLEEDALHKECTANQPTSAGNEAAIRESDQKESKAEEHELVLDETNEYHESRGHS